MNRSEGSGVQPKELIIDNCKRALVARRHEFYNKLFVPEVMMIQHRCRMLVRQGVDVSADAKEAIAIKVGQLEYTLYQWDRALAWYESMETMPGYPWVDGQPDFPKTPERLCF